MGNGLEEGKRLLDSGEFEAAAERLLVVAEEAVSRGDLPGEASARGLLVQALILMDRGLEARLHAFRGLSIARQVKDADGEAFFQDLLKRSEESTPGEPGPAGPSELEEAIGAGQDAYLSGDISGAVEALEAAVAQGKEGGDALALASGMAFLAQAKIALGDLEGGRDAAAFAINMIGDEEETEALAFLESLIEPPDEARSLSMIQEARGALEDRDLTRVLLLLQPVAPAMADLGAWELEASARGMMAQALASLGRLKDALPEAQRAFEIARVKGNTQAVARFRELVDAIPRGDVPLLPKGTRPFSHRIAEAAEAAQGGDVSRALRLIQAIAKEAMSLGAKSSEATARHVEGQILMVLGQEAKAKEALNRGLVIAKALTDDAAIASFEALLGEAN